MFIQNKYAKWYMSIITQAKHDVNNKIGYCENHHIIPKCIGGTNESSNIVKLSAREHFICHLLLTKMTNNPRLGIALSRMMSDLRNEKPRYLPKSSKIYSYAKEQASIAMRGKNNPMYGKTITRTDEQKKKMSIAMKSSEAIKKSRSSIEWRTKISNIQSEETLLVSVKTGKIISSWKNCREISNAIGYTYANIKNARRDKRPIGVYKNRLPEPCYVIYRRDFT